ncbi:MAG: DUF2269 family protein [Mycobacteriales bacterium]
MTAFVLLLHLLGAFCLVSGVVVAGLAFESARRRSSPAEIALVLGLARTGALLTAVGTLLVAGFGVWLVALGHWGYGSGWVDAAGGLLLLVAVLGSIGGQRPKRARRLATQFAAAGQPVDAQLRAMLDDRLTQVVNYLSALLLLVIIVLMVTRPGAVHH